MEFSNFVEEMRLIDLLLFWEVSVFPLDEIFQALNESNIVSDKQRDL